MTVGDAILNSGTHPTCCFITLLAHPTQAKRDFGYPHIHFALNSSQIIFKGKRLYCVSMLAKILTQPYRQQCHDGGS